MVVSPNYDQITMQILLKVVRWTSLVSFPLFLLTTPNSSAWAGSIGSCAESLISSGVDKSAATTACSDASKPQDLAACVVQIETATNLKGNNALQSCYRVRRPDELASCVTTISSDLEPGKSNASSDSEPGKPAVNSDLELEKSAMILDSCRRSLLPVRHAECTLDLASIAEIEIEEALESCIAAELTPGEVAPETAE